MLIHHSLDTHWAGGGWWCPSQSVWPPPLQWMMGKCRTAATPEERTVDPGSWTLCCCRAPFPRTVQSQRTRSCETWCSSIRTAEPDSGTGHSQQGDPSNRVLNTPHDTDHHPVFRMHNVHWSSGLSLDCFVDDAPSHTVNQDHPDKTSLLMEVRALSHHGQKIGIQIL